MARPAVAVIWAEAPGELRFLTEGFGFRGPERTEEGVAYHRPGLHIDMGAWTWKNERGFTTTLARVGRHGTEHRASLGELYAASGLGTASAVPEAEQSGEIMEVRGAGGEPPYVVRFEDGHTGLVFPGPDAVIEHPRKKARKG